MDFKIILTNGEIVFFKNASVRNLNSKNPQKLSEAFKSITNGEGFKDGLFEFVYDDNGITKVTRIDGRQIRSFGFSTPKDY